MQMATATLDQLDKKLLYKVTTKENFRDIQIETYIEHIELYSNRPPYRCFYVVTVGCKINENGKYQEVKKLRQMATNIGELIVYTDCKVKGIAKRKTGLSVLLELSCDGNEDGLPALLKENAVKRNDTIWINVGLGYS